MTIKKRSKGYIHVYTGNGKGKTTAALGLVLRAIGIDKKIYICQFAKGTKYSELKSLGLLDKWVTIKQHGLKDFIRSTPTAKHIEAAKKGLSDAAKAIKSGGYDIVVLDEANIATHLNLFSVDELLHVISNKPEHVEIILTGRYAHKKIIDFADLVTEMREIKHYFNSGVKARKGIEC